MQDVKQSEEPQALQPASVADQGHRQSSRVQHWLSRLRAYLILDPLILSYTFVLGVIALIISFFDSTGRRQHTIARVWSKMIMATIFSRVTVIGAENLEGARAAVYAANHISAIDIPLLYAFLPFQFRIIAKEELFRTPCIGWYLKRSGQLPVDRSNARASIRSLHKAAESLKTGMPLVIFPEGGRAPDGHIMPFMDGPFYTAIKAGVDIVPMAIVGTFELLPMDGFHIQPRPLYLIIGKPIPTAGYSLREMESLAQQTQKIIEDMYYSRSTVPDPRLSVQT